MERRWACTSTLPKSLVRRVQEGASREMAFKKGSMWGSVVDMATIECRLSRVFPTFSYAKKKAKVYGVCRVRERIVMKNAI